MQITLAPPTRKSTLGPLFSMHDGRPTLRRRSSDESFTCGGFSSTSEEVTEEADQPLLANQYRIEDRKSRLNSEPHQSHLPVHCPRLDVPSNHSRKTRLAELEEMNRLYEISGLGMQGATKSKSSRSSNASIIPSIIPSAIPPAVPSIMPELETYDSIPRTRVIVQQLPERPMTRKYQTEIREGRRLTRSGTKHVASLPQNPAASRHMGNSTALLLPFPKTDPTEPVILERQVDPLTSRLEIYAEKASEEDLEGKSCSEATHKNSSSRTSRIRTSGLFGHILKPRKSENQFRTTISSPFNVSTSSPFLKITSLPGSDLRSSFGISSRMSFQPPVGNHSDIHVNTVEPLRDLNESTDGHVTGVCDPSSLTSHLLRSTSYSSLCQNTPGSSISPSTRSNDSALFPEVLDGPPLEIAQVGSAIDPKVRAEVRHSSSFLDFNEEDIEDSRESKHIWRNLSMSTMSKSTIGMRKIERESQVSHEPRLICESSTSQSP